MADKEKRGKTNKVIQADKEPTRPKVSLAEDFPNLVLLVVLYMFQGLPMGMFLSSVPLLFKKYLTY